MSGSVFGGSSSSSSSSSTRRGKKSGSSSDKPKQPQRGLGVAQLEKIRLHTQMQEEMRQAYAAMHPPAQSATAPYGSYPASQTPPSSYGYYQNTNNTMQMGAEDASRADRWYSEPQSRWNPNYGYPEGGYSYGYNTNRPGMTHWQYMEDPTGSSSNRNRYYDSNLSGNQPSGSSDYNDKVDLELKL